jgi:ComEC/Rec2-related protein
MKLLGVCSAALLGMLAGDLRRLDPVGLGVAVVLSLAAAVLARDRPAWRLAALLAGAAALGGLRASQASAVQAPTAPSADLAGYVNRVVRVRGALVDAPHPSYGGTSTLFELDARAVSAAGHDPPAAARGDIAPSAVRLRVVADPALLDPHEAGAAWSAPASVRPWEPGSGADLGPGAEVVLEGRLLAQDSRGPPTLLWPRLLSLAPSVVPAGPLPLQGVQGADRSPTDGWDLPAVERAPPDAALLGGWISAWRARAAAGLHHYLPEPQATLASGVLLGGSGGLDPAFRLQLQRAGLAHLLAIDGYKMVLVAGALGVVLVHLFGPRLATPLIWLGIAAYTLLTGAHPSAVRAGLMVGLASAAPLTGRPADPLTSLAVAAVVIGGFEPRVLLDVGLQLSLSATLGLILLWPRLRRRLRPGRQASPAWRHIQPLLVEPAGLTLAVTLATLPLMLSVFQMISLVSPIAHILAVPLVPLVLISAALLAVAAPSAALATPLAWLAWLPTTLLVQLVRCFGDVPNAALWTGRLPPLAALALALGLLVWGLAGLPELRRLRASWARARRARGQGRLVPAPLAGGMVLLATAWMVHLVAPDGQTHVYPFEVGHGSAVLIRDPAGATALVVQGLKGPREAAQMVSAVADHLAVWEHKLDLVVALDDASQAGLAPTLARYPAAGRLRADELGQARPFLQPDQDQQIQHDHKEHDDQLHPFTDDHGDSLAARR